MIVSISGSQPRDWAFKFVRHQTLDALSDLGIKIRGGGWIALVEVADGLDDVGDRFLGVVDLHRPRAASMI